jgi:hypothetical protein
MRWTNPSTAAEPAPVRGDHGLRVDPVRIGRGRSSGALAVCAAIAAVLGLAIAKPWGSPAGYDPSLSARNGNPRSVGPAPAATAAANADPSPAATRTPDPVELARRETVARASRLADWPKLALDIDHLARQPIVTQHDLGGSNGDGTCGGSARITPFDELIAIAGPPGERVAQVRLFAIDSIHRPDVPVRIWSDRPGPLDGRATDGVTVVELPSGGIAAREYALIADTTGDAGPQRLTYTICVG